MKAARNELGQIDFVPLDDHPAFLKICLLLALRILFVVDILFFFTIVRPHERRKADLEMLWLNRVYIVNQRFALMNERKYARIVC